MLLFLKTVLSGTTQVAVFKPFLSAFKHTTRTLKGRTLRANTGEKNSKNISKQVN